MTNEDLKNITSEVEFYLDENGYDIEVGNVIEALEMVYGKDGLDALEQSHIEAIIELLKMGA